MFSCYSDQEIHAIGHKTREILSQDDGVPLQMRLYAMVQELTRVAREHDWEFVSRYDLVNAVDTLAGVIEHNSAAIQCRGETPVHRSYYDSQDDVAVLIAAMKADGVDIPYDDLKTVVEDDADEER